MSKNIGDVESSRIRLLHFRSLAWFNVAFYLALCLLLLLLILKRTHGHFSYILDDPYIHLALAERLRHGLYGLNAGEPSSPSSSLIWPFLLAPFTGLAVMAWVPLIINVVCGTATVALLGKFVSRHYKPGWRATLLSVLLVIAVNALGLTYTGMEHMLEVALCVASAYGIISILQGGFAPAWTVFAALLLPSVRYEGMAVVLAMSIAIWATGRRRTATLLLVGSVLPLVAFSLYLHHLHLPFVPLSVLVKSSGLTSDHRNVISRSLHLLVDVGRQTLMDSERVPQFLLTVVLLYFAYQCRGNRKLLATISGTAIASGLQVLVGPVGWFYRYEMYCLAFTLPIVLTVDAALRASQTSHAGIRAAAPAAAPLPSESAGRFIPGSLLLLLSTLAIFYVRAAINVPYAAGGIAGQQLQLARFASEFYKGPVAVNDLGWVAFLRTADQYTLDLAALGSYEVFRTPESNRNAAWLDTVTQEHKVALVMIYPEWFKSIPVTWSPVAKLCLDTSQGLLGPAKSRVVFYATPLADKADLLLRLRQFQPTLPKQATLDIQPINLSDTCRK